MNSRLVDLHHRRFFQPLTPHQVAMEAIKCLLVGVVFGYVCLWAWTTPPQNQVQPSAPIHEGR